MKDIKSLEDLILKQINKIENEKDNLNKRELRTCKKCNKDKVRIFAGKYNLRDKKYVDENGKQWMGRTCPECNVERSKYVMRRFREKNKVINSI
ncbi:MAG: hypothetical protein QXL18_05210 [Candidatus Woesearchaeota archaeon]